MFRWALFDVWDSFPTFQYHLLTIFLRSTTQVPQFCPMESVLSGVATLWSILTRRIIHFKIIMSFHKNRVSLKKFIIICFIYNVDYTYAFSAALYMLAPPLSSIASNNKTNMGNIKQLQKPRICDCELAKIYLGEKNSIKEHRPIM